MQKWLRRLPKRLLYRLWLFTGGARTERGFQFLSDSILENRKIIYEQAARLRRLEARVWALEKHSPTEELAKAQAEIHRWAGQVAGFSSQLGAVNADLD